MNCSRGLEVTQAQLKRHVLIEHFVVTLAMQDCYCVLRTALLLRSKVAETSPADRWQRLSGHSCEYKPEYGRVTKV